MNAPAAGGLPERLSALYERCGYEQFRMSKFEEYDIYSANKRFLAGEDILTFTDKNGKLMALKPDITLSIVKNHGALFGASRLGKYYYRESVYRVPRGSDCFSEITQTGVECVGVTDAVSECEVILMANASLSETGMKTVLEISHMGILGGMLAGVGSEARKHELMSCVAAKNAHGFRASADAAGLDSETTEKILNLSSISAPISECADEILSLTEGGGAEYAARELCTLSELLSAVGEAERVCFDLSVVYDRTYYTGAVFRGFAEGIPERILSGGRYSGLVTRRGEVGEGMGFALYTDPIERKADMGGARRVDCLIVYGEGGECAALKIADEKRGAGKSALLMREDCGANDGGVDYGELIRVGKEGIL
ncbi:MAG: ATP phosphoribosyltransferase regulatory subunit [Clostridia bacterium]|nr:ATP phosphoribosyltransferase regulatory subunit [Clostridia bacterium]